MHFDEFQLFDYHLKRVHHRMYFVVREKLGISVNCLRPQ